MKLRDYQEQILEELDKKIEQKDEIVITLGMGGGKSVLISEIAKRNIEEGNKVVILVNIGELVGQIKEHLDEYSLEYNVIKSGEHIIENKDITLIMEQSYHKDKRLEENIECDILIKDEYHIGYGGKRYEAIKEYLKPSKVIGLSGTPYDENGFLLKGLEVDNLITYGSTYELTNKGYLTPLKYFIPQWSLNIDYSKVKSTNDYITSELDKKINTIRHTKFILQSMEEMNAKNKKTLVYCNSIEHCNRVNKELLKNGYKAMCVHSEKDNEENKEAVERFKLDKKDKNSIDCLVSISKLTTGFNEPKSELLVLCRPTKILRLYLQILFRVARLHKDKKYGEILDLGQCVARHGFGVQQQKFISSKKIEQKEKRKKTIEENVKNQLNLEAMKELLSKSKKELEEINLEDLEVSLKEMRIKNVNIEKTKTNDLFIIFENSWDLELIIAIRYELFKRMKNQSYTKEEVYYEIEDKKIDLEDKKNKEINTYLKDLKQTIKKEIKETKNV